MSRNPVPIRQNRPRLSVREPYDSVLIVCEGTKTEPMYLSRLRSIHRLSSSNIKVTPAPGTDPIGIVKFAHSEAKGDSYDKIYCVFDRDSHDGFEEARKKASELSSHELNIIAITSWPCFEFWILLHFEFTAAPFVSTGSASSCDVVIKRLRTHIPNYSKGSASLYDELISRQPAALENARRLEAASQADGSRNPSTQMHSLIEYLINLKG